jgi:hypothetical protein
MTMHAVYSLQAWHSWEDILLAPYEPADTAATAAEADAATRACTEHSLLHSSLPVDRAATRTAAVTTSSAAARISLPQAPMQQQVQQCMPGRQDASPINHRATIIPRRPRSSRQPRQKQLAMLRWLLADEDAPAQIDQTLPRLNCSIAQHGQVKHKALPPAAGYRGAAGEHAEDGMHAAGSCVMH